MNRPAIRLVLARFRCVALVAALAAVGCTRNPNSAKVSGQVTVDGIPVATGYLQFLPQPTGKGPAAGAAIAEGRYSAEVTPGKLLVLVNATRKTGKMIREYSEMREEFVSIVPKKYETGIPIEVQGDDSALNFELKSK